MGHRLSRASEPFTFAANVCTQELDELWQRYDRRMRGYISGAALQRLLEEVRMFFAISLQRDPLVNMDLVRRITAGHGMDSNSARVGFDLMRIMAVELAVEMAAVKCLSDSLQSTVVVPDASELHHVLLEGQQQNSPTLLLKALHAGEPQLRCPWARFRFCGELMAGLRENYFPALNEVNVRGCALDEEFMQQLLAALGSHNYRLRKIDLTKNKLDDSKLLLPLLTPMLQECHLPDTQPHILAPVIQKLISLPNLVSVELGTIGDPRSNLVHDLCIRLLAETSLRELFLNNVCLRFPSVAKGLQRSRVSRISVALDAESQERFTPEQCIQMSVNYTLVSGNHKLRPLILRNRLRATWSPGTHFLYCKASQDRAIYCLWVLSYIPRLSKDTRYHIIATYVELFENRSVSSKQIQDELRKLITASPEWRCLMQS